MPSSHDDEESRSSDRIATGDVDMSDAASETLAAAAAAAAPHAENDIRQDVVIDSIFQHLLQHVCIDVAATLHQQIKTSGGFGLGVPMASHVLSAKSNDADAREQDDDDVSPTVQSRLQLYPELYEGKSEEEIHELLTKYAVDLPMVDSRKDRSRKRLGAATTSATPTTTGGGQWASDEDEDDEDGPKKKGRKKKKIGAGSDDDDDDDEDYQMEDDKDDDEVDARQKSASSMNEEQQPNAGTNTDAGGGTTAPATLGMVDIWGNRPVAEPTNVTCECPLCGRHVSTSRFASHLDKCMGLSTRPLAGSATRG